MSRLRDAGTSALARVRAAIGDRPTEDDVSEILRRLVDDGSGPRAYFRRHPRSAVDFIRGAVALPVLTASPSANRHGRTLRASLPRDEFPRRLITQRAVLALPRSGAEYSEGASRQTLRRKSRQAIKAGVTWRAVTDDDERRSIQAAAEAWERSLPPAGLDPVNNADLVEYDLWLVAFDAEQVPLLLAVIPIDGDWAVLRYFRTIGDGTAQSNARYLMMQIVAEQLIERGARYLVDAVSPLKLSNGLRHFQRMLGFRLYRIRLV